MYLGALEAWVLKLVKPAQVSRVFASRGLGAASAASMGLDVVKDDPNRLEFDPAPGALCVHYTHRIGPALLARYQRFYNLHPGYLPWCRGLWSVNWAMWQDSPAGATLHEMTEELDAGPIVDQIQVAYNEGDLARDVSKRVFQAERELFQRYWRRIVDGETLPSEPQPPGGSMHTNLQTYKLLARVKDGDQLGNMSAAELVKLTRCFDGVELELGGERLRLSLRTTRRDA